MKIFKKYKRDFNKLLNILFLIVFWYCITSSQSTFFAYAFLSLFFFSFCYSSFEKIRYKTGKSNYVLFPTLNDEYIQSTSSIFGIVIMAFAVISIFWEEELNLYIIAGFLFGLILSLNGFFDTPNGWIRFKKSKISLSGLEEDVNQTEIKDLEIFKDKIVLVKKNGQKLIARNFNIDLSHAILIETYISERKINPELIVVNRISQI